MLVAMLAEGALEWPSVLVLAFHSSLFLVGGSSDGSVSLSLRFQLSSVASALSLSESWLFFLLWICREDTFEVLMRVGSSSSLHG